MTLTYYQNGLTYQFVIFKSVLLSVSLRPFVQVDGVLDVVWRVMLRRPIVGGLKNNKMICLLILFFPICQQLWPSIYLLWLYIYILGAKCLINVSILWLSIGEDWQSLHFSEITAAGPQKKRTETSGTMILVGTLVLYIWVRIMSLFCYSLHR